MDQEPVLVPAPVCEMCWLIDHAFWEPESIDEKGRVMMRLTGVDVPAKINNNSVEVCAMCGSITVAGIYDMKDPSSVDFLDDGEEDKEDYGLGFSSESHFTINLSEDHDDDMDEETYE